MLQKVSLFINNNFITTTCRVYFVIKSKDHEQLFHSLASYGHKFFHSRIYRPPFKLRVRRALEHPSFFLYYTVSFGWICVSQGEGRSTILSQKFSIPSFSSIPPPSNHISSFPRMGGDEKGNEDGEVLFSQSKVYRYMGQLVWRG